MEDYCLECKKEFEGEVDCPVCGSGLVSGDENLIGWLNSERDW